MKKYVYISGLAIRDNNRGTAALGYGAISFLKEKGFLIEGQTIIEVTERNFLEFVRWCVKVLLRKNRTVIRIDGIKWTYKELSYLRCEKFIQNRFRILTKITNLHGIINKTHLVAAINGGDGFSDIYGGSIFENRLQGINLAMEYNIPLVILPQTLGPFQEYKYFEQAKRILTYATSVYVRDECFSKELCEMGVDYELTNDLSYYMKPEPWEISIDTKNAVGINVSGLAWDNKFHTLAGQFPNYPLLMAGIVKLFQKEGKTVYLISHSYNYHNPELYNDDLKAARELYNSLDDKSNVVLIEKDLVSPQVKYVISRMSFFVGTRMHANFAAIFTKVPLFGLAYSYKFKGAFENNGIFNRTADINNIEEKDVDGIIEKIYKAYKEDVFKKHN